jgi:hypothetical protein
VLAEYDDRRRRHQPVAYAGLALVNDALGKRDFAIALLDTAVQRYDQFLALHGRSPFFDSMRRDPRAAAIFARAEGGQ